LLNVHLYFVKLFGCHVIQEDIPIDVAAFARSILNTKAHPYVYLKFGHAPLEGVKARAGMSDIEASLFPDGTCAFATWFYDLGNLWVNVMFAADGERRDGLVGAWHPSCGTSKLVIADFS